MALLTSVALNDEIHTSRSACSGRGFDRGPIPALDGIQNSLFFLTPRGEASDLSTGDNRLSGRGINDAGEDGASMTTAVVH
jgi:hypothetical protein